MYKVCSTCQETKPVVDFYKVRSQTEDRRAACKSCTAQAEKKYRSNNAEKVKERHKYYYRNNKEKAQEYHNKNRDARLEYMKQYNIHCGDKIKARKRAYREENIDYIKLKKKEYYNTHKEMHRAYNAAYRARKYKAQPQWADLSKIQYVYWWAKTLTEITGIEYQVDHIEPLAGKGICGLHVHENLQILTKEENLSKGNRREFNL